METCTAAVDIPGNKMDISATIGEEFDVIRKDKTPNNKWLVRNKQGHCTVICIFFKTKCWTLAENRKTGFELVGVNLSENCNLAIYICPISFSNIFTHQFLR